VAQYGADYLRHRTFIQSLLAMTPDQAYQALQQQVSAMSGRS
jgi:hypothetical protein